MSQNKPLKAAREAKHRRQQRQLQLSAVAKSKPRHKWGRMDKPAVKSASHTPAADTGPRGPKHLFKWHDGKVLHKIAADTRSQARAQIKAKLKIGSHGRLPIGVHIEQVT